MAQPCKVFTYTNVTTEKDALANIRNAAESGGWIIDKDAIDADRELYLHSLGNGSQKLFFLSAFCKPMMTPENICSAYTATPVLMVPPHGMRSRGGSPNA